MDNARATEELQIFNAIEAGRNDEESFYALCEYFDFLYFNGLKEVLEKVFRDNRSNLYFKVGEALFKVINKREQSPRAIWSDAMSNLLGKGNRSLMMYSSHGTSKSVGRTVHDVISKQLSKDNKDISPKKIKAVKASKVKIVINKDGISLASDLGERYSIRMRRKKLVWLLAESKRPVRMKECAAILGVKAYDGFKIGGDKGEINKIFKKKLGVDNDLIKVVSDGYALNRDNYAILFKA